MGYQYRVGRPLVPRGFVKGFLRVPQAVGLYFSYTAAQQARGTFRKFTIKPSEQVAAPPGTFLPIPDSIFLLDSMKCLLPCDNYRILRLFCPGPKVVTISNISCVMQCHVNNLNLTTSPNRLPDHGSFRPKSSPLDLISAGLFLSCSAAEEVGTRAVLDQLNLGNLFPFMIYAKAHIFSPLLSGTVAYCRRLFRTVKRPHLFGGDEQGKAI